MQCCDRWYGCYLYAFSWSAVVSNRIFSKTSCKARANMEDEYMTEPKVNKVTACKIHANRATMAENKEIVSHKSERIKKAA